MLRLVVLAVAMGLLVLFVAIAGPVMIGASDGMVSDTREYNESDSVQITGALTVRVDNVDDTGGAEEAEVVIVSRTTGETGAATIGEGETEQFSIDSTTVNVTADLITSENTVVLTTVHEATLGWDDGTKLIAAQLDVIVAIVIFVLLLGMLFGTARTGGI